MHRWRNSEKSFTSNTLARIMECSFGFIPAKKNCLHLDLFQMRKALKDQQDVNLHLRSYIDNVLMNIMEKHPELLEIRSKKWKVSQQCLMFVKELCSMRSPKKIVSVIFLPATTPDQRIMITWLADLRIQSTNQMIRWLFSVRKMMMIIAHWFLSNASQLW